MLASWEFKTVSAINLGSLQAFGVWKELLSTLHSFFFSALSASEGSIWNKWDNVSEMLWKLESTILTWLVIHQVKKQNLVEYQWWIFSTWIPLCDAPLNNRHNQLTGCLEGILFGESWAGQGIWLFHMHSEKTSVSLVASALVPLSKARRNKMCPPPLQWEPQSSLPVTKEYFL